jgi:PTH1 family peptidyl-tRNA hydrolase
METFLFVGLGNKGNEYQKNRHNAGFMALDFIATTLKLQQSEILKFSSSIFSCEYEGKKIIFAKPQTFMNLSGQAVSQILQFYKIPLTHLFVFHDDIDIENARIKFKNGGGNGGHNGLKSITQTIGNEYTRIRIGVGRPLHGDVANFVLSDFKANEILEIKEKITLIATHLNLLIEKKLPILAEKIQNT